MLHLYIHSMLSVYFCSTIAHLYVERLLRGGYGRAWIYMDDGDQRCLDVGNKHKGGDPIPQALKRPCNQPGCPELTNDSYCPEHKREKVKRYDQSRGSAAERGYSNRWSNYSRLYRKKNPLCIICLKDNRIVSSQHVDHIIAVKGPNDPLFWAPTNHQALCQPCHSRKTVLEDGGFQR
jgi:5-methylcytosine-specific restriction protein A